MNLQRAGLIKLLKCTKVLRVLKVCVDVVGRVICHDSYISLHKDADFIVRKIFLNEHAGATTRASFGEYHSGL